MATKVVRTEELTQGLVEFMKKIGCTNIQIVKIEDPKQETNEVKKGMNFLDKHERKDLTEYYLLKKGEWYIAYKWTRKPKFVQTKITKYAIKFKTEKEAQKYKNKYKGIDRIDEYEIVKQG